MDSTALDAGFDVWQADGSAVRIEYSRSVMEELRLAACDGFNRLKNGVEIGGVLFGVRDPDVLKIMAHRALACEYAFGPTFTLSEKDRRGLEELLLSPTTDSSLSGMQAVGWYHSHTRCEILLSEKDLQVYQQYFPESWQIALVLRVGYFEPVRAGFFFREPDGGVQASSSRQEFIVKPVSGQPEIRLPGDGAPAGIALARANAAPTDMRLPGDGAPAGIALARANVAPLEMRLPGDGALAGIAPARVNAAPTDMRLPGDGAPAGIAPARVNAALSQPAPVDPYPQALAISHTPRRQLEPPPSPAPPAASGYPGRRWAWSIAGIAVAFAGVLFWAGSSRASAGLSVRELDVGDQLRIDWNHSSRVIEQGQSGAVEIEDGSVKLHEELSQEYLRAGSITYLRTTGSVLVRLVVRGADHSTLSETSLYRGPPPVTRAVKTDANSADRSAKDESDAAPVPLERVPEAEPVAPLDHPLNRTRPEARVNTANAGQTPAPSPVRHRLVLPPAEVPRPAEPILPAPPVTATNTVGVMAPIIPRILPAPAAAPAPLNHDDEGPKAGKIIWTGKLARSGTIEIVGNRASQGHLTGGLPGVPIRVQVFPSELIQEGLRIFAADPSAISPPEAPGAQNGWNQTVYVLNPRKAGEIGMVEAPGQQNAWNRLILRAERGEHSIIVLRWERVPAKSALRTPGNR